MNLVRALGLGLAIVIVAFIVAVPLLWFVIAIVLGNGVPND